MKNHKEPTIKIRKNISTTLLFLLSPTVAFATGSLHEFTLEDKRALLDAHNQMRTQCATGQDGSQNGPTMAFQMQKVFWDPALEEMAKARAQACYYGHFGGTQAIRAAYEDVKHLTSYNSQGKARSKYATENVSLYVQNPPASQYSTKTWTSAVQGWFNEAKLFNWSDNSCFGDTCGHWSQMCYEETRYIGCAVANCDSGITGAPGEAYTDGAMQLVCAYWPERSPSVQPYRQTAQDLPFCLGGNFTDSKVCRDNLSSGGKSTEFIASGRLHRTPDQCEDGLGRAEALCNKEDDITPPEAVTNLSYKVTNGNIHLSWTGAKDDYGITAYELERRHNGSSEIIYLTGSTTQYEDKNTPTSGVVDFKVTAIDANNGTSPVASITANPSAVGTVTDITPPSNPYWIIADRVDQNVFLTWEPASDNKAVDHYVLIDEQGNELKTPYLILEIGDLRPRTQYRYTIYAVDTSGNLSSGYPVDIYFSTIDDQDTQAPQAPINFHAEVNDAQVELSWQPSSVESGNKFYLYRDNILIAITESQNFIDTKVSTEALYLYQLLSIDESGNKSAIKEISISTPK